MQVIISTTHPPQPVLMTPDDQKDISRAANFRPQLLQNQNPFVDNIVSTGVGPSTATVMRPVCSSGSLSTAQKPALNSISSQVALQNTSNAINQELEQKCEDIMPPNHLKNDCRYTPSPVKEDDIVIEKQHHTDPPYSVEEDRPGSMQCQRRKLKVFKNHQQSARQKRENEDLEQQLSGMHHIRGPESREGATSTANSLLPQKLQP